MKRIKIHLGHLWQRTLRRRVAVMIDSSYDNGLVDPVTAYWYEMGCPPILAEPIR